MNEVEKFKYADGRMPIETLYNIYGDFVKAGWTSKIIFDSQDRVPPAVSFQSPMEGDAVWIISGVHGEEPAGPMAVARGVNDIIKLGKKFPMVVIPVCFPWGYATDWRYMNSKRWVPDIDLLSVEDTNYFLFDDNGKLRADPSGSTKEGYLLSKHIVDLHGTHPPLVSLNFHEDNFSRGGYVYAYGEAENKREIASKILYAMAKNKMPVIANGKTRFNQKIVNGIIGSVFDSSIDELIVSDECCFDGKEVEKPYADMAFVIETPSKNASLIKRVSTHLVVIKNIDNFFEFENPQAL
jgi:hypothetical protein